MVDDEVTLLMGGTAYGGWKEIAIDLTTEALAGGFHLAITERFPGQPERQMPLAGGAAAVAIGGETVLTGYIDDLDLAIDPMRHPVTVNGRSKAGDLADCGIIGSRSFSGKLETIASRMTAPYGISVVADVDTGAPFKRFIAEPADSIWASIQNLLKQRGLIAFSGADGVVHILKPVQKAAAVKITEGVQPIGMSARYNVSERFSDYVVVGQMAGNDHAYGTTVAGLKGTATDPAITRKRTLVVMAEHEATLSSLKARAQWEAAVRLARSQVVTIRLPGWRRPDGLLWQLLQPVQVVSPTLWIDETLSVLGVSFRAGGREGKITELRLSKAEALSPEPVPSDADASALKAAQKAARKRAKYK